MTSRRRYAGRRRDRPRRSSTHWGETTAPAPVSVDPAVALAFEAEREALLDEIVRHLVGEGEAPFRSASALYSDFLVHWLVRRVRAPRCRTSTISPSGCCHCPRGGRCRLGGGGMAAVRVAQAAELPEVMQGVFLMLARAAMEGALSPGDDALARAYEQPARRHADASCCTCMEGAAISPLRGGFPRQPGGALPGLRLEDHAGQPARHGGGIEAAVIPGLVPGIHDRDGGAAVDGRDKPGHDGKRRRACRQWPRLPTLNYRARSAATARCRGRYRAAASRTRR